MTRLWTTSGDPAPVWDTDGRLVFGSGGGTTPPPEAGTDPALLTVHRHVVDRCAWWRTTAAAGSSGNTHFSEHTVQRPAKALRIRQGVHGSAGVTDAMHGTAGIVIGGAYRPLTWGGERQVSIPVNDSRESDPLPEHVQVEPGDIIIVVWETPGGGRYPNGGHGWIDLNSGNITGPFRGFVPPMTESRLSGSPVTVSGLTTDDGMSIAWLGDSFTEAGWVRNSFHQVGGLAWAELSQWAEGVPSSRSAQRNRLGTEGALPWDVVFAGHHGNNSTSTWEGQMEATLAYWSWIRGAGAKVATKTLHPYTDSTDGWTSIGGQTLQDHRLPEVRWARNAWLLDGAPLSVSLDPLETGTTNAAALRAGDPGHPLAYPVFDEAAACEDPATRLWKVDGGAWTVDGAHLTAHGSAMIEPHFEAWLRTYIA